MLSGLVCRREYQHHTAQVSDTLSIRPYKYAKHNRYYSKSWIGKTSGNIDIHSIYKRINPKKHIDIGAGISTSF